MVTHGETRRETAYLLTSLPHGIAPAARLLALQRGHWAIENRNHWVRDAVFGEDRARSRAGAAPLVLSHIRGAVLTLLRHRGYHSISKARRFFSQHPRKAVRLIGALP